jgi:hypothetical protein
MKWHHRVPALRLSLIALVVAIGGAIYTYVSTRSPAFVGVDITPIMLFWLALGLFNAYVLWRTLFSDKWVS